MTTMTWVIEWMQAKPVEGSLTDVVITAGWRCNGVDGNYTGTVYGSAGFPSPNNGSFTPYADLTQNQVLGWCWANGVDKNATETIVQTQINNQIDPPVIQPPLPWSA